MSYTIKSLILFSIVLMATFAQNAKASEALNLLTTQQFQQRLEAVKFIQEDLNKYEINNAELIVL